MKSYLTINNSFFHKKIILLAILIIGILLPSHSQIYSQWDWAVGLGGQKSDVGKSICTDQDGNIYITGYFQGNANFGNVELIAKGDTDIFIAKLDHLGNLSWIRQFGSEVHKNLIATEMGCALCTDKKGNIYLTGIFSLSTVFGDTTLNSIGGDDIFVAKLNSNGKVLWAGNYGSSTHDIVYDICTTQNGKVILSGVFGTKPSNREFNIKKSSSHAFLASIDKVGKMELIRAVNGTGYVGAKAITIDKNNNIYWGVNFMNETNFGTKSIHSKGKYDIFLEKIGPTGITLWSKMLGGKGTDKVSSLSIINGNELLLIGSFEEQITVDDETLISYGKSDFLLCQFDKSGNLLWLDQIGGKLDDKGVSILSTDGNIIVGGNFQGEVVVGYDTLFSSGYYDIAVISFDSDHQLQWVKQLGNEHGDFLNSLVIGNEFAYFTGNFRGSLYENMTQISSEGSDDIMLFAFTPDLTNNLISIEGNEDIGVDFTILPNPSNGNISISSNLIEVINVGLVINDAVGNKIKEIRNLTIPGNINLSGLSNGVYFIHISYNKNSFIKKAVIKH